MSGDSAGTATGSTDSGQGSGPLSDPFVAVMVDGGPHRDPVRRVEAPSGSAQLLVRRSTRVPSSRARSHHASTSIPPGVELVDALPGGKRRLGYVYQVLPAVAEEAGPPTGLADPAGNVGGLRDSTIPQQVSTAGPPAPTGRKRAASSAAPGSGRRGPMPGKLASAADFSPTHFNEPVSDGPVPPFPASHHLLSPMQVEPEATGTESVVTPFSSPISQNPLIQRSPRTHTHVDTPSPTRHRPPSLRTRDSNTAWAAAEGLLPIGGNFAAPGFVPAQLVGGVTYTVCSPHARSPSVGRRLFSEYVDPQLLAPSGLPPQQVSQLSGQQVNARGDTLLPQAAPSSFPLQQQAGPTSFPLQQQAGHSSVRRYDLFCTHILTFY